VQVSCFLIVASPWLRALGPRSRANARRAGFNEAAGRSTSWIVANSTLRENRGWSLLRDVHGSMSVGANSCIVVTTTTVFLLDPGESPTTARALVEEI